MLIVLSHCIFKFIVGQLVSPAPSQNMVLSQRSCSRRSSRVGGCWCWGRCYAGSLLLPSEFHFLMKFQKQDEFNINQPFLGGKTFSRPTLLTEPAKRQNLWTPGSGSRCPQRSLFLMTAGNLIVRSEHGRGAQSFDQQKAATRRHPQSQLLPDDPGEDEMVPPLIQSRVTTLRWNEPCSLVSQMTLP